MSFLVYWDGSYVIEKIVLIKKYQHLIYTHVINTVVIPVYAFYYVGMVSLPF